MPRVTCVQADGTAETFAARSGDTLMEAARERNIAGVLAQCGGACACATCHVHIDEKWAAVVGPPNTQEVGMLECVADFSTNSRLACQIELTDSMDGLVVVIPRAQ